MGEMSTKTEEAGPVSSTKRAVKNTKDLEAQLEAASLEGSIDLGGTKPKGGAKKRLKQLPGISQGIRTNASIRMKKLAQPVCPGSKMEFEIDGGGVPRPVPKGLDNPNHQMLYAEYGPGWIEACEADGHDPWHRTVKWYTKEDDLQPILDENGEPTGKLRKVGEILVPNSLTVPNVAQVPITPRHNNGQGAVLKVKNFGFKRLPEIGYEDVCEYRNCQKSIDPKFATRDYGSYCSREHLALVVADAEAIILDQVDTAGITLLSDTDYRKGKRRRDGLLRQAVVEAGAVSA